MVFDMINMNSLNQLVFHRKIEFANHASIVLQNNATSLNKNVFQVQKLLKEMAIDFGKRYPPYSDSQRNEACA